MPTQTSTRTVIDYPDCIAVPSMVLVHPVDLVVHVDGSVHIRRYRDGEGAGQGGGVVSVLHGEVSGGPCHNHATTHAPLDFTQLCSHPYCCARNCCPMPSHANANHSQSPPLYCTHVPKELLPSGVVRKGDVLPRHDALIILMGDLHSLE